MHFLASQAAPPPYFGLAIAIDQLQQSPFEYSHELSPKTIKFRLVMHV